VTTNKRSRLPRTKTYKIETPVFQIRRRRRLPVSHANQSKGNFQIWNQWRKTGYERAGRSVSIIGTNRFGDEISKGNQAMADAKSHASGLNEQYVLSKERLAEKMAAKG
jgi:hypothetical protein